MKQRLFELILIFITFFLPGFIWQSQSFSHEPGQLSIYMIQFLLIAVSQVLLIIYILWVQCPRPHSRENPPLYTFGIVKPRPADLPYSLVIYLGIFALLLCLSFIISLLPEKGQNLFDAGFRWKLSDPGLIPLVILFSIVTGYREELFFRSYLLTRFSQLSLSPLPSLLLSSLLFSSGHIYQGLAGFSVSFIQGIYFGIVFLKTRNIHRIALAHALYNTTILLTTLFTKYSLPINCSSITF